MAGMSGGDGSISNLELMLAIATTIANINPTRPNTDIHLHTMPPKKPLDKKAAEQQFNKTYFDHLSPDSLRNGKTTDNALLCAVDPAFGAAQTANIIANFGTGDNPLLSTMTLKQAIEEQTQAFLKDDATATTELLYGHVVVLNTAFQSYMQVAAMCRDSGERAALFDAALKAQEQARKTLQTLHNIKNPQPKTVYIKNEIVQQVNQLVTKTEELHKKLESTKYATVDTRSEEETERTSEVVDIPAAAVATLDGRKKPRGKGKSREKLP